MKIIAIANQKGGVGKTTTSVNLGACLAERGVNVIVLDLDPQANSTSALGFVPGEHPSIYQHLIGGGDVSELVLTTKYDHLSLIPCDMDLAGCEIEMAREDDHLVRLRNLLAPFKAKNPADYLLIDCPPSLGVLMTSALAAADAAGPGRWAALFERQPPAFGYLVDVDFPAVALRRAEWTRDCLVLRIDVVQPEPGRTTSFRLVDTEPRIWCMTGIDRVSTEVTGHGVIVRIPMTGGELEFTPGSY